MKENKLLFEAKVCSRCGGCGNYSFNLMHGTRCFKCGGRGWVLTKRGRVAQEFYGWLRERKLSQLQPGDVITQLDGLGLCYGRNIQYRCEVKSVEHLTGAEAGYVDQPNLSCWKVTHNRGSLTGFDTTTEQVVLPEELRKVAVAAALAFQSELNENGKFPKRKKRPSGEKVGAA